MNNTRFKASMALLRNELRQSPFSGVGGANYATHCQLNFLIQTAYSRDRLEARVKSSIALCFYNAQLLAIAFTGQTSDNYLQVFLVDSKVTAQVVSEVRTIIQDIGARAVVSYPVKAYV